VGTPGATPAVEHVDAFVGSWAEPTPTADAPNAATAVARRSALTPELDAVTLVPLASIDAEGPDVDGADVSGAAGFGCDVDVPVGAEARVPGPARLVDEDDERSGAADVDVDPTIGSLVAALAGPTVPPSAEADPPAVDRSVPGPMSGRTSTTGPPGSATTSEPARSAIVVMIATRELTS
jgi:hypothetical protein